MPNVTNSAPVLRKNDLAAVPPVAEETGTKDNQAGSTQAKPLFQLPEVSIGLLWVILFGLGGGLLSMYYANIGYLPRIGWEESAVFLGISAIAGFFLLATFTLLLYAPGLLWSKFLVQDNALRAIFCYQVNEAKPCLKSVSRLLAVPFLSFMAFVHTLLILRQRMELSPVLADILLFLAALPGLWLVSWVVYTKLCEEAEQLDAAENNGDDSKQEAEDKRAERKRHILSRTGFFALSAASSFFAVWMIHRADVPNTEALILLPIVCTLVVTTVNLFVALSADESSRAPITMAFLASLVLLFLGDYLVENPKSKLSARLVSPWGIGFDNPAIFIVTPQGRDILQAQSIDVTPATGSGMLKSEEMDILSSLGSEYFLRAKGRNFVLPEEEVISWSRASDTR